MAYNTNNFKLVTSGIYEYQTQDSIATITAADYFSDFVNTHSGSVGDIILVTDGTFGVTPTANRVVLQVTGLSSNAATAGIVGDAASVEETIDSGDAISVTTDVTFIDNTTSGAGAVTLAAPNASMIGKVKTIEMTVDGGDVTLALTNVQGQSTGTTATFGDVNDALVLVGGTNKWHVIGESGIALA